MDLVKQAADLRAQASQSGILVGPLLRLDTTAVAVGAGVQPIVQQLNGSSYFTGSITNDDQAGGVLQVVIQTPGGPQSFKLRPGRSIALDNIAVASIQFLLDPSSPTASVAFDMVGFEKTPQTDYEDMMLNATGFIQITPLVPVSLSGGIAVNVDGESLDVQHAKAIGAGAAVFDVTAVFAGCLRIQFFTDKATTIGMDLKRGAVTVGSATALIDNAGTFGANDWQTWEVDVEIGDEVKFYATVAGNFDYTVDNYATI